VGDAKCNMVKHIMKYPVYISLTVVIIKNNWWAPEELYSV
jgi:hypothetical protein